MKSIPSGSLSPESLGIVHPHAAGLDIGRAEIWVCVPTDRDSQPVRGFGTFTPDLEALADWLQACHIETVAMESTGVYWIPIYDLLEARGLQVCLVNARHVKNVPGRKSDVQDCQWIQRLHTYGLLNASFRPEAELCALRAYLRHRRMLIECRAAHIQHMQKALQQMNVQLTQVLSDITGETGLQIIRAIVAGQRDPVHLAQLRNPRCQHSQDEIAKALTGHYQAEHVFALTQALALYDFYTVQIQACDVEIEQHYHTCSPAGETLPPLPPSTKTNTHSKNTPAFDVRAELYRLTGVDLTAINGLNASTVQDIVSEIGTQMGKWPTEKHFCSWLHLAPHNDISGGKVLRSHVLKGQNRAAQAFRLAAQAVSKTDTALGAFYRRMRARLGAEQAIVATAHKLARLVYHLLKQHEPYQASSAHEYDQAVQQRELNYLKRKAKQLGFMLEPLPGSSAQPG
jgi:transposase